MPGPSSPGATAAGGEPEGALPATAQQVRDALAHLDDLAYLQTHALARRFQPEPGRSPASAAKLLRQALLAAIEAMRPRQGATDPHACRAYQSLYLRHVEGRPIPAVLDKLAISRSEYYRVYRRALGAVSSLLQARWPRVEQDVVTLELLPHANTSQRVPAPDTAPRSPSRLPLPLTSFVGREAELAELRRLLQTTRLLTLTGTGGCGKTRLAIQVASAVASGYGDGVTLVELAGLTDPALVPQVVASALGIREASGRPLLDTLSAALRARRLLLLLDNCEHLLDACARLVDALLGACPRLRVLATSREPLRIAGEVSWRVPSLAVPPDDPAEAPPTVERTLAYEAVQLFVDRARAALPGFAITPRSAAAVAQVCRRLDGIPLALELAAARVRVLTVKQLIDRLDQRFRLLTGGSRTALPRQQTLRAALDWSYDLLSEPERRLFHRLSVFAGGWTLEAAAARTSLRASALLTAANYAQMQGETAGVAAALREALGIFREVGDSRGEADALFGLAGGVLDRGGYDEAVRLFEESLAIYRRLGDTPRVVYRLIWLGRALTYRGEPARARARLEEGLALQQRSGNRRHLAMATEFLGEAASAEGDAAEARTRFEAALAIYEEMGDQAGMATVPTYLGRIALDQGDREAARRRFRSGLVVAREIGFRRRLCDALEGLAALTAVEGQPGRALRLAGASDALREAARLEFPPHERAWLEARLAPAWAAMGEAATAAWAEGQAMGMEQAVAYALEQ